MGSHGCANITKLDSANYSSPVPVIGLYVAGATLICLLLIVCDILHAFRHRKPWIPCRFFQINSFTLTILAVATKLPVDLTTTMPSAQDQLSKLCGTQLICICIVFMTPSIGNKKYFENLANAASLVIMVVTVIVNICIQMATGVIFLFMVEHIMTMILMFLLLCILCLSVYNDPSRRFTDMNRNLLKEEDKSNSMLQGLKGCYVSTYVPSSGLTFYNFTSYATMGVLCIVCLIIISVATIQSFFLKKSKICGDVSDYRWSMPIVVVTQLVTLVVGGLAIGFRSLVLVSHTNLSEFYNHRPMGFNCGYMMRLFLIGFRIYPVPLIFSRLCITKTFKFLAGLAHVWMYIMNRWFTWIDFAVVLIILGTKGSCACIRNNFIGLFKDKNREDVEMSSLEEQLPNHHFFNCLIKDKWLDQRTEKHMEIMIEKHRKNPSNQLIELLIKNPTISMQMQPIDEEINNCLLLVLLVRTIVALEHSSLSESLVHALEETFEIIYFIDKATRTRFSKNYRRLLAKDIWMSRRINNHWFQKQFIEPLQKSVINSSLSPIPEEAFGGFARKVLLGYEEMEYILRIINDHRRNESMEELYDLMKQVVIGALRSFLDQLPTVLFKYISKSPFQEIEERIELSLKFLCKLNLMESEIPWSLSTGEDIIRYFATTQINTIMEDNHESAGVVLNAEEVAGISSPPNCDHATDQV